MSEIVLLVEGKTETAIKESVKSFLDAQCKAHGRPFVRLQTLEMDSRLLNRKRVGRMIELSLTEKQTIGVAALIDVVSSGRPCQFSNAADAIEFLRSCGPDDPRYRPHAAQFDVEAWLLPYWDDICRKLRVRKGRPGGNPETVNQQTPPSKRLKDLYRQAGRDYDKPRDAKAILRDKDLAVSARQCPQLKAFLDSLLNFAGCPPLSG